SEESGARGGKCATGFSEPFSGSERTFVAISTSPARPLHAAKSQSEAQVDDHYLIALAKQGHADAYDRIVRRYYGFVRLQASSYVLAGGDSDDLIQEGLVGVYKAARDYRTDRESSFRNVAQRCITRQMPTGL